MRYSQRTMLSTPTCFEILSREKNVFCLANDCVSPIGKKNKKKTPLAVG